VACAVTSACLWIPGYPSDKAEPDPDPSDPPGSSHCSPHAGGPWALEPTRPLLIDATTRQRRFQCRITGTTDVTWTVKPVAAEAPLSSSSPFVSPYVIARGVSRVDLRSDGLPWVPHPYKVDLELRVSAGGNLQITTWPLVVLPHGDDYLPGSSK